MSYKIYVVHHSHTDLGYTDLQERVLFNQVNYIKTACKETNENFKWNCETYYCVENFLNEATEEEKQSFFLAIKKNYIGLSATYLNFTDIVDCSVLIKRTSEMIELFKKENIEVKTAMIADINGISLGARDALINNGVEFLYTNIHTHHGMYPLYKNMTPYYWENEDGNKLLVWNGEHYNLGNVLGFVPTKHDTFMGENYFGKKKLTDPIQVAKHNITQYIKSLKESGYKYDFFPASLSGVFSDNAPPNPEIAQTISQINEAFNGEVIIEMVTLSQLYELVKSGISDEVPTYKGDLTDWWSHGVLSSPYIVKHLKEAERTNKLVHKIDSSNKYISQKYEREYEDNALIYGEHTFGHSATISNPSDTMVLNLDIRKNSYASKAHEAASKNLLQLQSKLGDIFRYYGRKGKIKVINPGKSGKKIVNFYVEVWAMKGCEVIDENNNVIPSQLSKHPRGANISFTDNFTENETKLYSYREIESKVQTVNSRECYIGAERVKDIVNTYDRVSYKLPYEVENEYFKISYEINKGITSFFDKKANKELFKDGDSRFFTPIYEKSEITIDEYEDRRLMGRNIRGLNCKRYFANLDSVDFIESGDIFTAIQLNFTLEGTLFCKEIIKIYNDLPQIDFTLQLAKTLSTDIESVFLPLDINRDGTTYFDKGNRPFRPGVDQIPGTCMEYYLLSSGIAYVGKDKTIGITLLDSPMVYTGKMKHHPITLCDNKLENNNKPVYSWLMNNCWETNFKIDLSGIAEFKYSLNIFDTCDVKEAYENIEDVSLGLLPIILESE
jgi:hypothetical protein